MSSMSILMVEDDPEFSESVVQRLEEATGQDVNADVAASMADAVESLEPGRFDVAILDLSLPDSAGLDGLDRIRKAAPTLPIVVLTGTKPEDLGIEAVRMGAQDYLVKNDADGGTIARAVRYAIERENIRAGLERTITRLRGEAPPAGKGGRGALKEEHPDVHQELAKQHAVILESALRPGIDAPQRIRDGLDELSRRLHEEYAGPRDVVEMHIDAIDRLGAQDRGSGTLAVEGQVILLELMGLILQLYRDQTEPSPG